MRQDIACRRGATYSPLYTLSPATYKRYKKRAKLRIARGLGLLPEASRRGDTARQSARDRAPRSARGAHRQPGQKADKTKNRRGISPGGVSFRFRKETL